MTVDRFTQLQDVAGPVSRETFALLGEFEREFMRWAPGINLVSPSTISDVWRRHILDSAQLISLAPSSLRWLDLGSGGGFPGAIIAILLNDREGVLIDLVDSNRKKASFLRTTLGKLNVRANVHACRIQDAGIFETDIVTARALAPLPVLLQLSSRWLQGGRGLFHKGREFLSEIAECGNDWRFDLLIHSSPVAEDSVVLDIRELEKV